MYSISSMPTHTQSVLFKVGAPLAQSIQLKLDEYPSLVCCALSSIIIGHRCLFFFEGRDGILCVCSVMRAQKRDLLF